MSTLEALLPEEDIIPDEPVLVEPLITLAELLPIALELLAINPELLVTTTPELLGLPELPDATLLVPLDAETDDVAKLVLDVVSELPLTPEPDPPEEDEADDVAE